MENFQTTEIEMLLSLVDVSSQEQTKERKEGERSK